MSAASFQNSDTVPSYSSFPLLSPALCIMLVVMMRSKEIKTSRFVLMLIL